MDAAPIVHIIDDDEAALASLAFLLESAGMEAVTYISANLFLDRLANEITGCVVTDIRMPGMSGIELMRRLRGLAPALPVIVMTGHGDVALAVEAMKEGAADFLEKPYDDETMLAAVREALDRQGRAAARSAESAAFLARLEALSPREQDVLAGLISGKANKVIAFDLGISPRTVEIYRANVMSKTKAASLSDLVRMALLAEWNGTAG